MFNKSRQSQKAQKKNHEIQTHQRISLPSLKLHSVQKQQNSTQKMIKFTTRYNSQRKISFAHNQNQTIKLFKDLHNQQVQKNTNQHITKLHSYQSAQNLKPISPYDPIFLSKSKQVYISPSKRSNRLNKLPDILGEANFIKKNQDSVDTSKQEDQKFKKLIFDQPKSSSVQPQLWIIKKQKLQSTNNNPLENIIARNLSNQAIKQSLPLNSLITQPSSSQTPIIKSLSTTTSTRPLSPHLIKLKLVGPEAVQKFYSHYKQMDRIKQLQQIRKQINPLTIILSILESYNIPPKRMDIIKLKGNQSILDLNQIGLGHSISIKAISDILEKLNYFKTINLSYNSISFDRVDIIIPQLRGLRKIDLSHNRIGKQGVDLLASEVCVRRRKHQNSNTNKDDSQQSSSCSDSQSSYLEDLNLQENGLSDLSMNLFLAKAKIFHHLRILNLSKNFLGNHFALRLKQFLIDQNHLDELYLHWNDITSKGMKHIFQGLTMNKNLKVLDLSWNEIGYEAIPAINMFFKKNTTLLHLDISQCNITLNDTKQLSQSIKHNYTLIGLHYQGNQGHVDTMGFINQLTQNKDQAKHSFRNQILSRINGVQQIHSSSSTKYNFSHEEELKTCWICDGWKEKTITIKKIPQTDQACFIHFDFQHYKGVVMGQVEGNYQIRKMFPPDKIKFFITKFNKSKQFVHQVAIQYKGLNDFEIEKLSIPMKLKSFFIEKKEFRNCQFTQLNVMNYTIGEYDQLFEENYTYQAKCRPRTYDYKAENNIFTDPPPPTPPIKKPKTLRKKQRSKQNDKKARQLPTLQLYFNEQPSQSKNHKTFIGSCAQFDISNSKIKKLLWNSQQINMIKSLLQENYSTFVNIYNYLSNNCVNSVTSVFHVSETRLEHFLDFMHFETRNLSRAKIRLKLIATLSTNDQFSKSQHKSQNLQQRLLNRPQFFQFLLRVAMDKYFKAKKGQQHQNVMSPTQGFERILQSLKKYQSTLFLPSTWRSLHLHTYDISLVIKSYQHFIESIYSSYTGIFQKNMNTRTEKKLLLNQFKQIFLDANMRKTRQALKDAQVAFADSKQLQIEQGVKQYGLKYNQFLQAMIRMAYTINIKPINTEQHKLWQRVQQMQHHHEIKHSQQVDFQVPLFLKFQSLLKKIYSQNRQLYHSRKMDRVFERGIFSDQIEMFMEILKQRMEQYHQRYKPLILQHQANKKIKFNTMDQEHKKAMEIKHEQKLHHNITLQYLVQQLKIKYNKLSQELDKNYNEYDEVQQSQQKQQPQQQQNIIRT